MEKDKFNITEIKNLDDKIETLLTCKPLSEKDVKELCEKVKLNSDSL